MNTRKLKAYARYDGSGRVVPGSMVLRKKMPRVGRWQEVVSQQCCEPTTTTLSTTTGDG